MPKIDGSSSTVKINVAINVKICTKKLRKVKVTTPETALLMMSSISNWYSGSDIFFNRRKS